MNNSTQIFNLANKFRSLSEIGTQSIVDLYTSYAKTKDFALIADLEEQLLRVLPQKYLLNNKWVVSAYTDVSDIAAFFNLPGLKYLASLSNKSLSDSFILNGVTKEHSIPYLTNKMVIRLNATRSCYFDYINDKCSTDFESYLAYEQFKHRHQNNIEPFNIELQVDREFKDAGELCNDFDENYARSAYMFLSSKFAERSVQAQKLITALKNSITDGVRDSSANNAYNKFLSEWAVANNVTIHDKEATNIGYTEDYSDKSSFHTQYTPNPCYISYSIPTAIDLLVDIGFPASHLQTWLSSYTDKMSIFQYIKEQTILLPSLLRKSNIADTDHGHFLIDYELMSYYLELRFMQYKNSAYDSNINESLDPSVYE